MKILTTIRLLILAAACAALLPGCSDDQEIGMTLEGTWRGAMSVYTDYGSHRYQSVYSEVQFSGDPFRMTRGSGHWVDHYRDAGWRRNYIANHFRWRVDGRVIRIHFQEEDTDLEIRDYRLDDDTFTGVVRYLGEDGRVVSQAPFAMTRVDSPNWDDYDYDYPPGHRSWAKPSH